MRKVDLLEWDEREDLLCPKVDRSALIKQIKRFALSNWKARLDEGRDNYGISTFLINNGHNYDVAFHLSLGSLVCFSVKYIDEDEMYIVEASDSTQPNYKISFCTNGTVGFAIMSKLSCNHPNLKSQQMFLINPDETLSVVNYYINGKPLNNNNLPWVLGNKIVNDVELTKEKVLEAMLFDREYGKFLKVLLEEKRER